MRDESNELRCEHCDGLPFAKGGIVFNHAFSCPVRKGARVVSIVPASLDALVASPPLAVEMAWARHVRGDAKCKHKSVLVRPDGTERGVECGECGRELDAIAVLAEYAEGDRRLLHEIESVKQATSEAAATIEKARKATEAAKRGKASAIARNPLLRELVALRQSAAKTMRGHSDEDVERLRSRMREGVTHLIDRTIARIEEMGDDRAEAAS